VQDPAEMKGGLDQESLPNFVAAARGAVERSGLQMADVTFLCPLHTKRSMFLTLLAELGMREDQAVYLDDTGHMSGVDSLLGLDRAVRDGRVKHSTHSRNRYEENVTGTINRNCRWSPGA